MEQRFSFLTDEPRVIVTGGAGFIGSAMVRHLIHNTRAQVLNVDKLSYAADLSAVTECEGSSRYSFAKVDITDLASIRELFVEFRPTIVINFAAESHVDRSINDPNDFLRSNIFGVYNLLQASRDFINERRARDFIFHQVSTDEVYGDLPHPDDDPRNRGIRFTDGYAYRPSSPYSATKASADHLVGAWHRTYGLPTLITNCSNNYGPYQHGEKLIPTILRKALTGDAIPLYGDGRQIRDWLFVEDHVRAICKVLESGTFGETYLIGGGQELMNIELAKKICSHLDILKPKVSGQSYSGQIEFVGDRPGHDLRYSIDDSRLLEELKWERVETLESGLDSTIQWYLTNLEKLGISESYQ